MIEPESKEELLQRIKREYGEDKIKELTHNYNDEYVDLLYGFYLLDFTSKMSKIGFINSEVIELNSLEELKESIEKQYDKKNIAIL